MNKSYCFNLFLCGTLLASFFNMLCDSVADPTDGFTPVRLTEDNFNLQRPYDVPLRKRYSFKNGVRRLWVYAHDKSHAPESHTKPRTEVRIKGLDYSSGVWQFEGNAYVPNGTTGVTIFQIFGAPKHTHATTMMLRIHDGNMRYYSRDMVSPDIYDRWFKVNVIHDVDRGEIYVFIDGVQKYQTKGRGPGKFYFKCGVYAQKNMSNYMESRWRDIKIYNKY
ncbi:citrate-binding protein-like [Tripterygium wilfordii]|uniref:Citrate-binding protein-like n=1 Tax=Tripterygium wilfordii TaxID=458696 RepID=A0A7J7CMN5_TRIWF|nr:citrate-binding protein-like [Tripterygium wilfordii]KAF5735347.1 citrate-binding protein-like [Tripterygium wilfordii]